MLSGMRMSDERFIEGEDRTQATLFPERIDDYITEDSPVRVVDVFIDDLDVSGLCFRTEPNATGRPSYHPKMKRRLAEVEASIHRYLERLTEYDAAKKVRSPDA